MVSYRLIEVVLLLRNKLSAKDHKVVSMTLSLVEALVKNGTELVHASIGNDTFMKEMAATARKYHSKPGIDNREVADQCLDLIQMWGEGFSASGRGNQYPAFTKYYYELRREGLPFNQQFDASKLPDFAPPVGGGGAGPSSAQEMEDEILAAALAASLNAEDRQQIQQQQAVTTATGRVVGMDSGAHHSNTTAYSDYPTAQASYPSAAASSTTATSGGGVHEGSYEGLINAAASSCSLLQDCISASTTASELRSNDLAEEVANQIRQYQTAIMNAVEAALIRNPEVLACL